MSTLYFNSSALSWLTQLPTWYSHLHLINLQRNMSKAKFIFQPDIPYLYFFYLRWSDDICHATQATDFRVTLDPFPYPLPYIQHVRTFYWYTKYFQNMTIFHYFTTIAMARAWVFAILSLTVSMFPSSAFQYFLNVVFNLLNIKVGHIFHLIKFLHWPKYLWRPRRSCFAPEMSDLTILWPHPLNLTPPNLQAPSKSGQGQTPWTQRCPMWQSSHVSGMLLLRIFALLVPLV